MSESSGFASDRQNPLTQEDYLQIAAQGLNAPKVIKINKKFVRQATMQQLGVAIAQGLAQGVTGKNMTKNLVKQGVAQDYATSLVIQIKQSIEDYKKTPEGRRLLASQ